MTRDVELWIKPTVCVLTEDDQLCEDELDIVWRAKVKRSLCLWQDYTDSDNEESALLLECWRDEKVGRYSVKLNATRSLIFYIKEHDDTHYVASQTFTVIHDTQRYRRRHRNPWSFF